MDLTPFSVAGGSPGTMEMRSSTLTALLNSTASRRVGIPHMNMTLTSSLMAPCHFPAREYANMQRSSPAIAAVAAPARRRSTRPAAAAARQSLSDQLKSPAAQSKKRAAVESSKSPPSHAKKPRLKAPPLKAPPAQAKNDDDFEGKDAGPVACCICMSEPDREELSLIDGGCEHRFCFECISKWADRENTCPLCKNRFTTITRVHQQRGKKKATNSRRVKKRDQRSDIVSGSALEGLLASLSATGVPAARHNHLRSFLLARLMPSPFVNALASRHDAAINFAMNPGFGFGFEDSDDDEDDDDDDDDEDEDDFHHHMGGWFSMHSSDSDGPPPLLPPRGRTGPGPGRAARANNRLPPRSFATNGNDLAAGTNMDNPLEIDDDDDEGAGAVSSSDDDDEVEVVDVRRGAPP
jgi:hypothetical protein